MTEREWLDSQDPVRMLAEVDAYRSARKLRLFACAVGRFIAPLEWREMLDAVEDWAEHAVRPTSLSGCGIFFAVDDPGLSAHYAASDECARYRKGLSYLYQKEIAGLVRCVMGNPYQHLDVWRWHGGKIGLGPLRDPSVNWVTPEVLSLAEAAYGERHLNGTLDNVRLCVLADCLEEQGCPPEAPLHVRRHPLADRRRVLCGRGCCVECESCSRKPGSPRLCDSCLELRRTCASTPKVVPNPLLSHLRDGGIHCRGDWVVDLVLGKS